MGVAKLADVVVGDDGAVYECVCISGSEDFYTFFNTRDGDQPDIGVEVAYEVFDGITLDDTDPFAFQTLHRVDVRGARSGVDKVRQ